MGRFFLCTLFLLFTSRVLIAQCDSGIMSSATAIVCEGNLVNSFALNTSVGSGCVLAYFLHQGVGSIIVDIVDRNYTGTFAQSTAEFDEIYNICSAAGPDLDLDGFPDLDNPETSVTPGPEVVFLRSSFLQADYICDTITGKTTITIENTTNFIRGIPDFTLKHTQGTDTFSFRDSPVSFDMNLKNASLKLLQSRPEWCVRVNKLDSISCFYDLALRISPENDPFKSAIPGDTIDFIIEVFNQGTLPVKEIELNNFIPNGFILNDANWKPYDNNRKASFTINDTIFSKTSKILNLSLYVDENAGEGFFSNILEIGSFKNLAGEAMEDFDSTPDNNPNNDGGAIDNVIDNTDGDEDDHDIETIQISITSINNPLDYKDVLTINSIAPLPVFSDFNVNYNAVYGSTNFMIYNIDGKIVLEENRPSVHGLNKDLFNVQHFETGIYFMQLINDGKVVTARLVKQ